MTVGFYSPLPPARTGVADYAAALLNELRRHGPVEIAPRHCDVALYQVGNNGQHAEIYQRALQQPGVIVLHDAVLHHFLLGQLSESAYIEEFAYNYGEWNRGLAQQLWSGRASSGSDSRYFEYPMLKRIVERSRAVVVHNSAAAAVVRKHVPGSRVVEIPHLFVQPPNRPNLTDALRWRHRIGVEPANFLFGVFGYLRESKRLVTVLEAFAPVRRDYPKAMLLVAGQFVSTDLERAVQPMLSAPGVFRLPHLEESEFWQAANAVDACINLRYPAAGETSGIAIRLMGLGKPVMMTDSLECARFPEDACIRIDSGPGERESLRDHMVLLTGMPEVASAIGERASAHIQAHHRVEEVGALYWQLLRDVGSTRTAVQT